MSAKPCEGCGIAYTHFPYGDDDKGLLCVTCLRIARLEEQLKLVDQDYAERLSQLADRVARLEERTKDMTVIRRLE